MKPAPGFVNAGAGARRWLTKYVRTKNVLRPMKNHRQGRTAAGDRALRRAHARRLLATLAGICRHLRARQTDPVLRVAYRDIEQQLHRLARWQKP